MKQHDHKSGNGMNQVVLHQFDAIKAYGQLPSPQGVALQMIRLADKDTTTTRQIAQLIGSDPVLAGRIIKVANLLTPRHGRPIASIEDAVTMQGIKSVRQLALSLSLIDDFKSGACRGFDYQKFWVHSVCTALAAQSIVEKLHVGIADEAFLLGLLSQIGRLALATVYAEEYSGMLASSEVDLLTQERNAFGLDHNQITALMLSEWGMPKFFEQIALHIEQPELSEFSEGDRDWRMLHLLHFSGRLASVCTSIPSERYQLVPRLMLLATRAGVETAALIEVGDHVICGMTEWGALLNIEVPTLPPFEEILNSASISAELNGVDALHGSDAATFRLRILLVDDDRATRLLYKALLEKSGHSVKVASNGLDALESVKVSTPQLIISDWMMPEMDGVEFCRELRKNPEWHKIYVFIVTAHDSAEKLIEAFEAGANDYLSKPVNSRILAARLRSAQRIIQMQEEQETDRLQLRQFADELAASNRKLQQLAMTDALTGLPNRRYAMERLGQEWALASRMMRTFCCMVVDIDLFKLINDNYGHQTGDEALKLVASSLQQAARKQDVVCRVGGEEFMVICPDSDTTAGFIYAERLRQHVAAQMIHVAGMNLCLTVSIGLTDNAQLVSTEAMLHQADTRLYAAKAAGRNCTVFS